MPEAVNPVLTWDGLRLGIQRAAEDKQEWAGCPLPVPDYPLTLEPRYPFPKLNGAFFAGDKLLKADDTADEQCGFTVVNSWRSVRTNTVVHVIDERGRRSLVKLPLCSPGRKLGMAIGTLAAGVHAWSVEAEVRAVDKLGSMVTEHAWDCYVLTGSFLETSTRSGVTYLFRKNRPTLALVPGRGRGGDDMRILAALCLHPIGYYQGTWAGVMVPTDEVVAHLILMRGDEAKFWAKCNKHDILDAEAGL